MQESSKLCAGKNEIDPSISLVAITHNRKAKMTRLLNSLKGAHQCFSEIVVVDDASTDGTSNDIGLIFSQVRILHLTEEVFLAKARNIGASQATGKYILFVDDDIITGIDSIKHISTFMETHPDYGIAGPVVGYLNDKREVWHAGVIFNPNSITESHYTGRHTSLSETKRNGFIDCSYLPGIFMIRRDIFKKLNGFDFLNFPFSYEDLDLALRTRSLGLRSACVLSALAFHDIDAISGRRIVESARAFHHGRSRTRFYLKYYKWKLLWLPLYFSGFVATQSINCRVPIREIMKTAISYVKGIVHGVAH